MDGLLVVLGATGVQGASVIDKALEHGVKVRALTRDPFSDASRALRQRGVEVTQADMEDMKSMVNGFRGATAIFAVTDFWVPFVDYAMSGRQDAWKVAEADEIRKGQNIVDAACQTLDTLKHFVFSSLPSPDRISNHEMPDLLHYEGKVKIVDYIAKQGRLSDVTTILYCGYYMENFTRWELNSYLRPRQNKDGSAIMSTRAHPSTIINLLNARRDIGSFVVAALQLPPQGVRGPPVFAYSQELNFEQIAATIKHATGIDISYRQSDAGVMTKNVPVIGKEFEQMYNYNNAYAFAGNTRMVMPSDLGLDKDTGSFDDFIRQQRWEGFVVEE